MKNLAIFAPVHFFNSTLLSETLDSILSSENDTLLCSETSSVSSFVNQYAKENELTVQLFQADWLKNSSDAAKIRDKEMIALANEILLFNDGESKKIDFLKSLALEKGIPVHEIKINSQIVAVSSTYPELNKLITFEELSSELGKITKEKEKSIQERNYEYAAQIRDKIRFLNENLETLF